MFIQRTCATTIYNKIIFSDLTIIKQKCTFKYKIDKKPTTTGTN